MRYCFLDPEEIIGSPDFEFIISFLKSTGRTEIGWHYCVDLTWIYSQAKNWPTKFKILDAGGGKGPTQFLLTELGFNVTNIDLLLDTPQYRYRHRYGTNFSITKSYQETEYVDHLSHIKKVNSRLKKFKRAVSSFPLFQHISSYKYNRIHEQWHKAYDAKSNIGKLDWVQANICSVPEIASNTFDAVVSLSALEHIPFEEMPLAWMEISRICKPSAKAAITTSATEQENTWFHEPSKGYCFSETDLNIIFGADPLYSNLPAEEILQRYRSCRYLKNNIAFFYSKSDKNGMPWGKWNPTYFPVGLLR